jgi:hypothetical protein
MRTSPVAEAVIDYESAPDTSHDPLSYPLNSDSFLSPIANNLANPMAGMAGELGIMFSVSDLVARQDSKPISCRYRC